MSDSPDWLTGLSPEERAEEEARLAGLSDEVELRNAQREVDDILDMIAKCGQSGGVRSIHDSTGDYPLPTEMLVAPAEAPAEMVDRAIVLVREAWEKRIGAIRRNVMEVFATDKTPNVADYCWYWLALEAIGKGFPDPRPQEIQEAPYYPLS